MHTNNTHRSHQPLLWWALVLMLAMLSYYVHLLNGHVQRGAQWRQSFSTHAAPAKQLASNDRRPQRAAPAVTRTAQR